MSTSAKRVLMILMGAILLTGSAALWSQTPASAPSASATKLQPITGAAPPFCETCGTVIAINRISKKEAALHLPAASTPADTSRVRFEVVVRLNAGKQQVITYDLAPQLTIGQKVRITDGVIVPELG